MRSYLVAYDISDPRRLRSVHQDLKREAVALQYSVFLASLGDRGLQKMIERLAQLIDRRADDVRIYPVPADAEWQWLGARPLPREVYLMLGNRFFVLDGRPVGGDRDG